MTNLRQFSDLIIDWNLTPEHAVTMYLEWGNNDWNAEYPPVRSKADVSTYFVVDTWDASGPVIRLVQRNSEKAVDLVSFPMPAEFVPDFRKEHGNLKGIFTPTQRLKEWLKKELGH